MQTGDGGVGEVVAPFLIVTRVEVIRAVNYGRKLVNLIIA
jgi:hypothetical protein